MYKFGDEDNKTTNPKTKMAHPEYKYLKNRHPLEQILYPPQISATLGRHKTPTQSTADTPHQAF